MAKSFAQPFSAHIKASFDTEKTTNKTEMPTPDDDGEADAKSVKDTNEFKHPRNTLEFIFALSSPSAVQYNHYLLVQMPQQSFAINTPPPECC